MTISAKRNYLSTLLEHLKRKQLLRERELLLRTDQLRRPPSLDPDLDLPLLRSQELRLPESPEPRLSSVLVVENVTLTFVRIARVLKRCPTI